MKKTTVKIKALSCMASAAKKTSSFFANVPCTWWQYQPKTPKPVKKMRKF